MQRLVIVLLLCMLLALALYSLSYSTECLSCFFVSSTPSPGTTPNPFVLPWEDHQSPSGNVRVLSVAQDHRTFPPADTLPRAIRAATFPSLAPDPRYRVFQLHIGLHNKFYNFTKSEATTAAFDTVELTWHQSNPGAAKTTKPASRQRLAAHQCLYNLPRGVKDREESKAPTYLELIVRCAFRIDDELMALLLDHAQARAVLNVHLAGEVTLFPLSEVFHLARPSRFLPTHAPGARFPAAPWDKHHDRLRQLIVRPADGADAAMRVGIVTLKKYSWSDDDLLWLMWALDVVGADHVVINVATRDLKLSTVVEALARCPGLSERVALVDMDIPTGSPPVTYSYLMEVVARDSFMRWQADFDYFFVIDPDEFVQLFDTQPPFARLDVKTFIARNQARIRSEGVAYLRRPTILRSVVNEAADPLLPEFLATLPLLTGEELYSIIEPKAREPTAPGMARGKSLFWPPRAVYSSLHANFDSPLVFYNVSEAHMLHIREGVKSDGLWQYLERLEMWQLHNNLD